MIIDKILEGKILAEQNEERLVKQAMKKLEPYLEVIRKPKRGKCPYDKSKLEHHWWGYYHYQKCNKCNYEYGEDTYQRGG